MGQLWAFFNNERQLATDELMEFYSLYFLVDKPTFGRLITEIL